MVNKVIVSILVLILILMGGIGYYSYTLNQQIDWLGRQLSAFEMAQTARVDAVSNELTKFQGEILNSVNDLEDELKDEIGETQAEIDILKEEIGATQNQINGLEDEIDGALSQIENLEDRLSGTTAELTRSVIDASKVYQRVSQATVRINDGQNTVGSGFIFDIEGHIVTASHVIDGLSEIYVILPDGRISKATSVGHCQFSDIAVLKLKTNPAIEPPPLADSSRVRIGEPVVALGSPLDLRDTLTAGIISQTNRYAEIQYDAESRWVANLLQFDAAVNAGNSGCPLANADGEVIGIVVARIQPNMGDGIYYAVAANKVKRIATALIDHGYYDYPWVGVGITNLNPQIVQDRGLETANGVLVGEVFSDSPAKLAGIKVNDIILSVDDTPIRDWADLNSYLGEYKSPGDMSKIGVMRGSSKLELSLEIGKRQP